MGIKFEFSLLGRSHIHWDETGCRDVIVEVSYDDLAALALANGYVKLEPGQVVVDEHPFTDEEADYLLEAIETTKCSDCDDQCKARGNCLYLNIRAKLTEIKEARDE